MTTMWSWHKGSWRAVRPEDLMTVEEAAAALGVTPCRVYELVQAEALAPVRVRSYKRILLRRLDVERRRRERRVA